MQEAVLRHVQAEKSESFVKNSLLEALVKANEAQKHQVQRGKPSHLTDTELYGNVFVFNLAGYETTPSGMTFALSYLAAHPEVQDWLAEGIDAHYTRHEGSKVCDYDSTYPMLVRCLAVMHETLRLAAPGPLFIRQPMNATEIPISTPTGPTTLTVKPGTAEGGHFYSTHLSPRWGPDANTFNPKRFVSTSPDGKEALMIPEGPLFSPWMFGPRVSPGKKFSQVEFMALIAQILSEWKVEVLRRDGESEAAARARLMEVIDGKYFNISTHLRRPEDAGVAFVRR